MQRKAIKIKRYEKNITTIVKEIKRKKTCYRILLAKISGVLQEQAK